MRLKHIKLAGFKSFVDPTKVPFEHQMTAIVGPNGCGKSNIIDAVRWVLGESSAKNLRGDAMTDVIFNGASTRKPVGQASVELLFDNMSNRIHGSMADRNQISIRRVVNRDSQNSYYLNGTKCRRKDITDIFLGTGLGPRSYAIIEQGTISRLIESKPQELRVFIEEAAGISKYKERRKDTENRIRHTRENLARLSDIRIELNNQIEKLYQQAESAKRYKTLKTQERKIKAELIVLRWQKHAKNNAETQKQIDDINHKISQHTAHKSGEEVALFNAKQKVQLINEAVQQAQQQKISLTNDIARVEQHIKHVKQQQTKLNEDKITHQKQIHNAQQNLLEEQQQLAVLQNKCDQNTPELLAIEKASETVKQQIELKNRLYTELQKQWQDINKCRDEYTKQQLEQAKNTSELQTKNRHIEEQLVTVNSQLLQLTTRYETESQIANQAFADSNFENNVKQLEQLSAQSLAQDAELVELEETIGQLKQLKNELQANEMLLSKQIYFLHSKLAIKADWQTAQRQWLKENDVIENVILQEKITIEKAWQHAVEMVLSYQLQASCIDKLPFELLENDNTPESLFLISQQPNSSSNQLNNVETLASKISNGDSYIKYLNSIKIADNIEQALALLPELLDTESVICPQGIWLSRHFIRKGIIGEKNDHFDYQQDLDEQRKKEKEVQSRLKQVEASLLEKSSDKKLLLAQQQTFVHKVSQLKQNVADEKQRQALAQQSTNLLQEQIVRLNCEIADLVAKQHEVNSRLMMVNSQSADTEIVDKTEIVNTSEDDVHLLSEQLSELQKTIGSAQEQQAALTQEKHTIVMVIEKNKHQIQQLQQNVVRYQESINQLTVQQTKTNQQINDNTQPLLDDEQKLQNWLQEMSELDGNLQLKQLSLKEEQSKINSIEQTQGQTVELLTKLKEQLSQSQVEAESNRLKAETALEQLAELGKNVNAVLENMPDNARESQWQAQLIVLSKDIQVLGAINLAAIDEYESQLTRKNYLDQQDEDLNLAITTLESAIEKIDKESRHKFKLTFDKVNQDLQSLFPKVFGGGQAYLTLTGDDLLDTGITIMARPPGKKNSTIHLLSGGEKALTALSLVFAIFRLNPAPFCMLDEVDAPLDDANVSRFCNLVKEMSQTVQFIYISHNKIAMEMATHLTGITMFEAGVSRMVSVDIDEAVAMAEVS